MKSVIERLQDGASSLDSLLDQLQQRSSLRNCDLNSPGSPIVFLCGDHAWNKLGDGGPEIQRRGLEESDKFQALVSALLRGCPQSSTSRFEEAAKEVAVVLQQGGLVYEREISKYFDRAKEALRDQVALVRETFPSEASPDIFVPDTNALLFNTALDSWRFAESKAIRLLLVPTVVAELDELKIAHRNPAVRDKAETLISQIKEYRRRGRLIDGVPLRSQYSEIAAWAAEPKVEETLPWLDKTNADDRLIASMIEVMRKYAAHSVTLVTRDLNLQNKMEFARLPFVEPPEPQA